MTFRRSVPFLAAILWVAALCYFTLFWNLNAEIMREWDESHNSVNALYMAENHNWLVRYYDDRPDMWETKPPLLIWLQVLSINSFGYNLWAFRLPSALAAVGTAFLILLYLNRKTGSQIPGVVAVTVLLSSAGYLFIHGARSAEHEALLILFEMGMLLSFYEYLFGKVEKRSWNLFWGVACLGLGVFTKSIAIAMLLPGLFVLSLFRWNVLVLLKDKRFYLFTAIWAILIGLYYYLHERQTPGYLQAVWNNELFPRFFNSTSAYDYKKVEGPFHYLRVLAAYSFRPWIWYVLPALGLTFLPQVDASSRRMAVFFFFQALIFYLVISTGTYNPWYVNPVLPMLSIVIGLGAYGIYQWGSVRFAFRIRSRYIAASLIAVIAFIAYRPLREIRKFADFPLTLPGASCGAVFSELRASHPEMRSFFLRSRGYNQSLYFYFALYKKVFGYDLSYLDRLEDIPRNVLVMAYDQDKDAIERLYQYDVVVSNEPCLLYRVLGPKQPGRR